MSSPDGSPGSRGLCSPGRSRAICSDAVPWSRPNEYADLAGTPLAPVLSSVGVDLSPRVWLSILFIALATGLQAEPVAVRNREGLVHGFLTLRSLDGTAVAEGALLQTTPRPDRVETRLVFTFKDGSSQDETVVFTQDRVFLVLSFRLMQEQAALCLHIAGLFVV